MAKSKNNKLKVEKIESEEQIEIARFIRILVILVVLILGIYFFTRIFVTKDLFNNSKDESASATPGAINYDTTLIGSMLSKSEDEYYVIAYKSEDMTNSIYYSGLVTNYKKNEKAIKVYYADLSNELNKKYYDKENVNTSSLETLKLGDVTLLKISKGKIVSALTEEKDIETALAYTNQDN